MKKMNIAIAVVVVAICIFGWFSVIGKETSKNNQYGTTIAQADAWMEEGLFQRAILNYKEVLAHEPSVELYDKVISAYQARMVEVSGDVLKDTRNEYVEFLEKAVAAFPAVEDYARMLGELLLEDEDYQEAYDILCKAVNNGVNSEPILTMLRQARYAWDYRGGTYTAILPLTGSTYNVKRTEAWGTYSVKDGTVLACEYTYVSQNNADGVQIVTDERDSRLVNEEGLVMGIFEQKVTDAGLFSDGLIPATCDGVTYDYYDEYARKQFGGYEMAGTFSGGVAAVKQNGLWFLIDEQGKKISDTFVQIVLKNDRTHTSGEQMLAAKREGTFTIFDEDMKAQASFDAEAVDVLTDDGIIAFCRSGKWGFVDMAGTVVIEPRYTQARSFSCGLAAVCEEKWGFIDPAGTMVIEPQFMDAMYFDSEGCCPVRVDLPPMTTDEVMEQVEQVQQAINGATADAGESTARNLPPALPATEENTTEPTEPGQADGTIADAGEDVPEMNVRTEEWRLLKLKLGIMED